MPRMPARLVPISMGEDQTVTIEEWGAMIGFCDTIERIIGTAFVLSPHFANHPSAPLTEHVVRFVPFTCCPNAQQYLRSLFSGRIARTMQIVQGFLFRNF